MSTIAFIGLGAMGSGMAANLLKAGHAVRAFDLVEAALAKAEEAGATRAANAATAASGADAVVTMLPAGQHVRAVYENEVFAAVPPHAILMDCSTIDVATARSVGEAAAARGLAYVDAPVSGGTVGANAGTLTFMVGGPEAAFAKAEPYLASMGKAVVHAGGPGAGQAAKICNNMVLGVTMIATCEAFALARKLGLSDESFYAIASRSSAQSWSLTTNCPVPGPVPTSPANRDYAAGFQTALMLKDMKLALEAGRQVGQSLPLASEAGAFYELFATLGQGTRDFSAILKLLDGTLLSERPA